MIDLEREGETMRTTPDTGSYAGKPSVRSVSSEFGALSPVSAARVRGQRNVRRPARTTSPVISFATKNAGLMIYELLGMAELMRVAYEKGELESVRDRISLLVTEAAGLAAYISDILELNKIEADAVSAVTERFDIITLLHDVVEAARSLAGDKAVTVMDISSSSTVMICSDPSKIRRILTELMSNAVNFTERGRISLIMGRDDGELKLTIADTGRGMSAEQINSVLESYDHGYEVEMNGIAISGLGLRIVKALVKKLAGRLFIASKLGEGTIVTVYVPLTPQV
jgi:signal transduction histidine kinase